MLRGEARSRRGNHRLKNAMFLAAFASLRDPASRPAERRGVTCSVAAEDFHLLPTRQFARRSTPSGPPWVHGYADRDEIRLIPPVAARAEMIIADTSPITTAVTSAPGSPAERLAAAIWSAEVGTPCRSRTARPSAPTGRARRPTSTSTSSPLTVTVVRMTGSGSAPDS